MLNGPWHLVAPSRHLLHYLGRYQYGGDTSVKSYHKLRSTVIECLMVSCSTLAARCRRTPHDCGLWFVAFPFEFERAVNASASNHGQSELHRPASGSTGKDSLPPSSPLTLPARARTRASPVYAPLVVTRWRTACTSKASLCQRLAPGPPNSPTARASVRSCPASASFSRTGRAAALASSVRGTGRRRCLCAHGVAVVCWRCVGWCGGEEPATPGENNAFAALCVLGHGGLPRAQPAFADAGVSPAVGLVHGACRDCRLPGRVHPQPPAVRDRPFAEHGRTTEAAFAVVLGRMGHAARERAEPAAHPRFFWVGLVDCDASTGPLVLVRTGLWS